MTWGAYPAGNEHRPWKMAMEKIGKSSTAMGHFPWCSKTRKHGHTRGKSSLHNQKGDQSISKPGNIWVGLSFQDLKLGSTYFQAKKMSEIRDLTSTTYYTCIHTHTHTDTHIYIYMCIHVYIIICVYNIHIYIYVYTCVYHVYTVYLDTRIDIDIYIYL